MTILSIAAALLIFVVLVVTFLYPVGAKSGATPGLFDADSDLREKSSAREHGFSTKIIGRVFSDEDQIFVAGLGCSELRRALTAERKRIAICWIRSNALEARAIARAHVRIAAEASDLRVSGEILLGLRYIELRLLCLSLMILVVCFGPAGLRGLAGRADARMARLRASRSTSELNARAG